MIHNISLPSGEFDNCHVEDFFAGCLDVGQHSSFQYIESLRVSSHLFIRRNGEVIQFVDFTKRAWHAGVSSFNGVNKCNDFSIGIELEGTDYIEYTNLQYTSLSEVTKLLMNAYPKITNKHICGHCDIAPGRKTDPGEAFDWKRYLKSF
ncbi:MAG: AmpD protein [Polaribacter sp.]